MTEDMTVRLPLEPTTEVIDLANQLPIRLGWAVFEHREGLLVNYSTSLRAVFIARAEAEAECEHLQAAESRLIYEVDDDPESHALDHTSFSVSPVKLTGSTPEITVRASYTLAEG